jgi:hypothetical protein
MARRCDRSSGEPAHALGKLGRLRFPVRLADIDGDATKLKLRPKP